MEVFDKIQRVRFQNTYGVDQTYHDLEDGWERMVPYEFENAINFDHVPYGQRSRKQLERILRSLDPEEIVVSEREYRAGESPLKYECKD